MSDNFGAGFFAHRLCMREPISDLWDTAILLDKAADAHLAGDGACADSLLRAADVPAVREWTESLWGSAKADPKQAQFRRVRTVDDAPPCLPETERVPQRKPSAEEQAAIIARSSKHWLQFDHILPHSRGGDNSLSNVVVTCAGCNYGRMHNTLAELGLIDPRVRAAPEGTWDGLERVLPRPISG